METSNRANGSSEQYTLVSVTEERGSPATEERRVRTARPEGPLSMNRVVLQPGRVSTTTTSLVAFVASEAEGDMLGEGVAAALELPDALPLLLWLALPVTE